MGTWDDLLQEWGGMEERARAAEAQVAADTATLKELRGRAEKAQEELAVQLAANEELRKRRDEDWQVMFNAQMVVMQASARQHDLLMQAEREYDTLRGQLAQAKATDEKLRTVARAIQRNLDVQREAKEQAEQTLGRIGRERDDLRARLEGLVRVCQRMLCSLRAANADTGLPLSIMNDMEMEEALEIALDGARAEGKAEPEQAAPLTREDAERMQRLEADLRYIHTISSAAVRELGPMPALAEAQGEETP